MISLQNNWTGMGDMKWRVSNLRIIKQKLKAGREQFYMGFSQTSK